MEAEKPNLRTTSFWVDWLQGTYAAGFIGIAADVSNIARIFLSKSTRGSEPVTSAEPPADQPFSSGTDDGVRRQGHGPSTDEERATPKAFDSQAALNGGLPQMSVSEVLEDEPKRRAWIERLGIVELLMRAAAIVLAATYGGLYFFGTKNHSLAVLSQQMRYVPFLCGRVMWDAEAAGYDEGTRRTSS